MYPPPAFREDDLGTIHAFIERHPFGVLTTAPGGVPFATHLAFGLAREGGERGMLVAHMARANSQWRHFEEGAEALVVFTGPHDYVSPTWYADRANVPTWNYTAVHAYGRGRIVDEPSRVREEMASLARTFEGDAPGAWSLEDLPESALDALTKAIVVFEIPIERLEAKFKLSQNRSVEDMERVARALRDAPRPNEALAEWMDRYRARR
ncbi:MAG: FMN-binding negative transcriptional regulator, partial [Myxococcales bacterium]|nr:FMN-binding negative transcriptional regulator [Myxococcales bacterium]